jgi:hypothetical protein
MWTEHKSLVAHSLMSSEYLRLHVYSSLSGTIFTTEAKGNRVGLDWRLA